jgi:hypothetical protein
MRTRFVILSMIALLVLTAVYLFFAIRFEYSSNEYVHARYDAQDTRALADFYVAGTPLLGDRPYVGSSDAAVSMIAVVDFLSPESRTAYRNLLGTLSQNTSRLGSLRLYHKFYLPREDYDEKKGRFIYATAVRCIEQFDSNQTVAFILALMDYLDNESVQIDERNGPSLQDLASLAVSYGFAAPPGGQASLLACLSSSQFESITQDMVETELFRIKSPSIIIGILGKSNTVIVGTPSAERIWRIIRQKQIMIGI